MTHSTLRGVVSLLVLLLASPVQGVDAVRLVVSRTPLSTPLFVADERGYFAAEGLNVQLTEVNGGHRALKALLAGDADFATTSDLPIMFQSFSRDDYRVLATFVTSSADSRLVVRANSGVTATEGLAGRRIGVVRGSSSHFFLDLMLLFHGVDPANVDLVALQPEQLAGAIERGSVDAVSAWEPFGSRAIAALDGNSRVFDGSDLYRITFNLVCRRRVCERRPEVAQGMLRALVRAMQTIDHEPGVAQDIASTRLGMSQDAVVRAWPSYDFRLSLEQSLLITLEAEARWAQAKSLVAPDKPPNYLRLVDLRPLSAVAPEHVSIIR